MLAVRDGNELSLSDLPDSNFFEEPVDVRNGLAMVEPEILNHESVLILMAIGELQNRDVSAGRDKISMKLSELGCEMTSAQVRTRLGMLERQGYLIKKRGRQGTALTDKGIRYLRSSNN